MDQEREDYADPETPDQAALAFDLSTILGAVLLSGLAFLPVLLLAGFLSLWLRW